MNDPADRKATAQDAVNSESESDNISIRVARGVRKRASSGLWHGPLQYGYKRKYDPDTGKVVGQVLDPDTAPIVRELVERLLAGHSVTSIWKDLNARGVPCSRSGEWYASKIRAIVLSPVIAGLRQYKGRLIKAQWPEIVTEAGRETLVALLVRTIATAMDGSERPVKMTSARGSVNSHSPNRASTRWSNTATSPEAPISRVPFPFGLRVKIGPAHTTCSPRAIARKCRHVSVTACRSSTCGTASIGIVARPDPVRSKVSSKLHSPGSSATIRPLRRWPTRISYREAKVLLHPPPECSTRGQVPT